MNCQECKQRLLDYAYGELPSQLNAEFSSALQQCPDCQSELARIQSIRAAVQDSLLEPPALVRANILREARKQLDRAPTNDATLLDAFRALILHPSFAAACAILLVISVSLFVKQEGAFDTTADESSASRPLESPQGLGGPALSPASEAEEAKPSPLEPAAPPPRDSETLADKADDALASKTQPEPPAANAKKVWREQEPARANEPKPKRELAQKRRAPRATADRTAPPKTSSPARSRNAAPTGLAGKAAGEEKGGDDFAKTTSTRDTKALVERKLAESAKRSEVAPSHNTAPGKPGPSYENRASRSPLAPSPEASKSPAAYRSDALKTESYREGADLRNMAVDQDAKAKPKTSNMASSSLDFEEDAPTSNNAASDPAERYSEGVNLYNRGDFRGAVQEFEEVPSSSNYYALALFQQGKSEFRQGNYSRAVISLRKVINDFPDSEKSAEARWLLAKSLLKGDPDNAEARRILTSLARGGGAYADRARQEHDRAFGRRDNRSRAPSKRKKSKAASPSSLDFEEADIAPSNELE